jgi:acyl-coenzyme A thioesterase PaaI-like protein
MTGSELEALRAEYAHCFGCGRDNPIGLSLDDFTRSGDTVSVEFVPRRDYRGFADVLHGGIVATALDEILAWTAILVAGTMAVTAKMELRFRTAAPAAGRYLLRGTLVEQRGRRLVMEAQCSVAGVLIAEANALFIATETIDGAPSRRSSVTTADPASGED